MARIQRLYETALPIVRDLREDPDYEESDAYGNFTEEEKVHTLTTGPLRGSGALALQVCIFPSLPTWDSAAIILLRSLRPLIGMA